MADLENRVSNLETKFDMFIGEMRDFKNEMRKQNEMRAAEIARVDANFEKMREQYNADMKALAKQREKDNAKHYADMKALAKQREEDNAKHAADIKAINEKIEKNFDNMTSQFHTTSIATILGVGAIVWAVVSALK